MEEFPMDLVEEILLRLEVKHILRCKLVSKNVYSLIKSPRFVSAHLHDSKYNKRRIAVLENDYSTDLLYLLSPQSHCLVPSLVRSGNTISLMGSCNGLLCIMTKKYQTLLFNPVTREYRELPVKDCYNCDQFGFGFGYDAISDDYKVVKICRYRCPRPFSVQVWSATTNEWTKVPLALPNLSKEYDIDDSGLFVRGNLYWRASPRFPSDSRADILFSVSLADCTVHQIPMPHVITQENSRCTHLTEYMGHLGMFNGRSPFFYDLWVMEDNADREISWDKRLSNMGPFFPCTWPTKVCVNGEFVMQNSWNDEGILYNPHSKEIKELLLTEFRWSCSMLWSLEESLVSP